MSNSTYDVVLTNQVAEGQELQSVKENLCKLFKTTPHKIDQIFTKNKTTIKKNLPENQAKKFQIAIHKAGGVCKLEQIEPEAAELPDIVEPIEPKNIEAEIQPFNKIDVPKEDKRVTLGLVYEKSEDSEKQQEAIESVDTDNFCPECGTIRASENSLCLHCNYDPDAKKQLNVKKFIGPVAAVLLVSILAYMFGLPAYNEYSKKSEINQGLMLAFEVKNKVTTFIEKTNFWPNQNIDASLPKTINNEILESVVISENAVVTATLRASVLNKPDQTLIFTPRVLKGRVIWNCHKGTLETKYRPEFCIAQNSL